MKGRVLSLLFRSLEFGLNNACSPPWIA